MRPSLEDLSNQINWIDTDNLYQAIADLKKICLELVEHLDKALPLEVEPD